MRRWGGAAASVELTSRLQTTWAGQVRIDAVHCEPFLVAQLGARPGPAIVTASRYSRLIYRAKLIAAQTPLLSFLRETKLRFARGRGADYDRDTRQVIRRVLRPDSTAIDIGANFGSVLRDMVKSAPRGRHHAFEPLPELARILRRRFPDVVVHETALSNRAGTMNFMRVRDDLGLSGFHPTHRKASRLEWESISVRTDRLDAIIGPDETIDLLKVDVEGAEFWVLDGARELLARDLPVVLFESGISASRSYDGSTPEAIHRLLTACGLTVSLMKRWLAGQPPVHRGRVRRTGTVPQELLFHGLRRGLRRSTLQGKLSVGYLECLQYQDLEHQHRSYGGRLPLDRSARSSAACSSARNSSKSTTAASRSSGSPDADSAA